MNKQQNNSAVFEMILQGKGGSSRVAEARALDGAYSTDWNDIEQEGQLAVDVLQDSNDIVVVSTMAGAVTDKLEVYVHGDLLTIRGRRLSPIQRDKMNHVYHEECFWGLFSRTIVLPVDVHAAKAMAEYNNGILIVRIPIEKVVDRSIPITIVDE
jgi:HSP20 family protein